MSSNRERCSGTAPRVGVDGEARREGQGAFFQPLDAEQLVAKRLLRAVASCAKRIPHRIKRTSECRRVDVLFGLVVGAGGSCGEADSGDMSPPGDALVRADGRVAAGSGKRDPQYISRQQAYLEALRGVVRSSATLTTATGDMPSRSHCNDEPGAVQLCTGPFACSAVRYRVLSSCLQTAIALPGVGRNALTI